ncbi:uncharacterized protein LOC129896852 [Solanum dulcamara]|uniref:uncharacterized protein LOC129896852 n=1 Tax=Solanum dulcamara TaxID=45834 RepID=UPI002486520E|nr:uncharacterized protein LOC129896852 [Solanum dulcamara]
MGREWLYWGSGSNKSSTQRGGIRRTKGEEVINNINEEATPPPGGCMCFQIFDLPHFQVALNQQSRSLKPHHHPSFLQQHKQPSLLKGLEAPRNSLELDEPVTERKSVSSSLSSSSTMKVDEQNLNITVGIQIRTSCDSRSPRVSTSGSRTRTDHDISSECSSSSPAGTKTPTLVARLMGLDLLPENNNSPRISISTNCNTKPQSKNVLVNNTNNQMTHHQSSSKNRRRFSSFESSDTNYITTGTLSLPETPRISLARRSDVDHHHQQQHQHHHRLSLQINKENMGDAFEFSDSSSAASVGRKMSRSNRRGFYQQENENQTRSPGYYARQIVKQVKESVSRKVGHDITNTTSSIRRKDDQLAAKYDQVVLLKPKKSSHGNDDDFRPTKQTTPSCSPRFRFLEPKSSSTKHQTNYSSAAKTQTSHSPKFSPLSPLPQSSTVLPAKIVTKPKPQSSPKEQVQQRKGDKFVPRKPPQACDAIRSKKEELFVRSATGKNKANFGDKKCKLKTPLSNQLVNTSTVPTILPLRKDPSPSPTKLLIKQSPESDAYPSKRRIRELSSSSSQSYYYKLSTLQQMNQDKCSGGSISVDGLDFDYQYIQRILKRTGLDKSTPISLAKWYSPSHPLDPSIFHYLELFNFTTHSLRSNRKLIFQLVDELLLDILMKKPSNFKYQGRLMDGEELVDTLCTRIRNFPSANCQVLEDIDALIDKDMQIGGILKSTYFDEEVESIVCEIERDIMEEVVHDTV